jgi:hypothetical protein
VEYTQSSPKTQPRRAGSHYRDAAKAEQESRRQVFNDLPAFSIDFDTALTHETRRRADALFQQLQIAGRKIDDKRRFWQLLFRASQRAHYQNGVVMYPRNKNHPTWTSTRQQVIDAAVKAGFFDDFRSLPGASPHMSRLQPTARLATFMASDPWTFDDASIEEFVELRDRESGEPIGFDIEECPIAASVCSCLQRVNEVNARYTIECLASDAWDRVIRRQLRPVHYAVFHTGWKHGRIYTGSYGHQNLSKLERASITFDKEPSIELDYSGYHPRILYHQKGIDFRHDPYRLWGSATTPDLRRMAKVVLNAAINACDRKTAIAACNFGMRTRTKDGGRKQGKALREAIALSDAQRRAGKSFAEIYDRALSRHTPIVDRFGSGIGAELMTEDAKIALDVLLHFATRSIPCLGIHDSFIVPRHAEAELRQVMMDFYERRFGFLPAISDLSGRPTHVFPQ